MTGTEATGERGEEPSRATTGSVYVLSNKHSQKKEHLFSRKTYRSLLCQLCGTTTRDSTRPRKEDWEDSLCFRRLLPLAPGGTAGEATQRVGAATHKAISNVCLDYRLQSNYKVHTKGRPGARCSAALPRFVWCQMRLCDWVESLADMKIVVV